MREATRGETKVVGIDAGEVVRFGFGEAEGLRFALGVGEEAFADGGISVESRQERRRLAG